MQTVASTPSPTPQTVSSILTSPAVAFKLVFLSFLSLAPILARDRLRSLISPAAPRKLPALGMGVAHLVSQGLQPEVRVQEPRNNVYLQPPVEERQSRWAWVQEWKTKIRLPSQSRTRETDRVMREAQLNLLVQEKRALELDDLPS